MKSQTILDYIISLTIFVVAIFSLFFFLFSLFFSFIDNASLNIAALRALVISQQLIYFNGSAKISETIGLNSGSYNELNYEKILEFIKNCNSEKDRINDIFLSKNFYLRIGNLECYSSNIENKIKRLVVINDQIEIFEIGITI